MMPGTAANLSHVADPTEDRESPDSKHRDRDRDLDGASVAEPDPVDIDSVEDWMEDLEHHDEDELPVLPADPHHADAHAHGLHPSRPRPPMTWNHVLRHVIWEILFIISISCISWSLLHLVSFLVLFFFFF